MEKEKEQELRADLRRTMELLGVGEIVEAVMLSGEALARADGMWRKAVNARTGETAAELDLLLQAGYAQVEALKAAGEIGEAYSLTMVLLCCTGYDPVRNLSIDRGCMALWLDAFMLLRILMEQMPADDAVVREHVQVIVGYIASMLYYLYNRLKEQGEQGEMMNDVYSLLRSLTFAVQTPVIDVAGAKIEPATRLSDLMADLTGRGRGLGIFNVEGE